MANKTRGSIMT